MNYPEFLAAVIERGITAAKTRYIKPEDEMKLRGSLAGLEVCGGKDVQSLVSLLKKARITVNHVTAKEDPEMWFWRSRYFEVESVCNVVSSFLERQGLPIIVQPTVQGVRIASGILGV